MNAPPKRGRPRPQESVDRDRAVLRALVENGPMERNNIAIALKETKSRTWLALDRLALGGWVDKCTSGRKTLWCPSPSTLVFYSLRDTWKQPTFIVTETSLSVPEVYGALEVLRSRGLVERGSYGWRCSGAGDWDRLLIPDDIR